MKGLFSSIYGATDQGIFDIFFARQGSSPPIKRMDIRLGDYGDDGQLTGPPGFFRDDIAGFPIWLFGVGFLGFAWAIRRKRKKQSSHRR